MIGAHDNAKDRRSQMVGVPHHQGSANLLQFGRNWVCDLLHDSCNSFLMLIFCSPLLGASQ